MTPARPRGSSCTTDIWWDRRTSETAFFQKSAGLFHCSLWNREALFTSTMATRQTHSNPIKIWCCHVAFADGDTFLGELSNLGDHMTWPFIRIGYCYTKYQGKEHAKHIHPTTIDRNGAYMRTCSICNLFVTSFARTHCPTSLLPSNTFSPRRPTLR